MKTPVYKHVCLKAENKQKGTSQTMLEEVLELLCMVKAGDTACIKKLVEEE